MSTLLQWCSILILVMLIPVKTTNPSNAGDSHFPMSIGVRPHYGFIIIHSQDILPVKDSHPFGFGIDLSWHYNSKKAFDRCLCFPRLGISTTFWNYDSPEILGNGVNTIFFIEPFFGINNKVSFSFRAGTGLAYASLPYDPVENPENLSYSTRFSFALQVAAGLNVWLSDKMMMNASVNYNHISNGGMKDPNKGINYPTFSLGFDYYIRNAPFTPFPQSDWRKNDGQQTKFFISSFATKRELEVDNEQKTFPAAGLNFRVSHQVSRINALGGGVEVMGDWSNREKIEQEGKNESHYMAGLFVGNDFLLGRFVFGQQFGVYVFNPYGGTPDLYQRYFLDLLVTKMLTTGVGLKAHGHVADFLDFRVGVSF